MNKTEDDKVEKQFKTAIVAREALNELCDAACGNRMPMSEKAVTQLKDYVVASLYPYWSNAVFPPSPEQVKAAFEQWCHEQGFDITLWIANRPESGYHNPRLNDYLTGWKAHAERVGKPGQVDLTEDEVQYIFNSPIAIELLMSYHSTQQDQANAMDLGCFGNQDRYDQLKAIGRAIVQADPQLWTEEIRRIFGVR